MGGCQALLRNLIIYCVINGIERHRTTPPNSRFLRRSGVANSTKKIFRCQSILQSLSLNPRSGIECDGDAVGWRAILPRAPQQPTAVAWTFSAELRVLEERVLGGADREAESGVTV